MTGQNCHASGCLSLIGAAIIGLSIAASGWFVKEGLKSFNMSDRVVSVKGLAERNVEADLAIWSLTHSVTGNDLAEVQNKSEENEKILRDFLSGIGFTPEEITSGILQSQDLLAQSYRPEGVEQGRYIISQSLTLRTSDFSKLERAQSGLGSILRKGVSLANQQTPSYVFTKLNDIKPEMLAESTSSAREAAGEFAKQSGANVGDIKRASQGVFQILPRDLQTSESEQYQRFKTVRVVSTIDFYLQQ